LYVQLSQDDIGFEIASLCVLRNLSIENTFVINNTWIVYEHLENLLYFLNTVRKWLIMINTINALIIRKHVKKLQN